MLFRELKKNMNTQELVIQADDYATSALQKVKNDIDGAIDDLLSAVYIYPYDDSKRKEYTEVLASLYFTRAQQYSTAKNWDNAIADYCLAVMFLPNERKKIENLLAQAYLSRADSYFYKSGAMFTQGKHEDAKELGKLAYFDATAIVELEPDGDFAFLAVAGHNIRNSMLGQWPEFADLPPNVEPAVQAVIDELESNAQPDTQETATHNIFSVGDTVFAEWNPNEYYLAQITQVKMGGRASVEFYDGTSNENALVYHFDDIVQTHNAAGNPWAGKRGPCEILDVSPTHVVARFIRSGKTEDLPIAHIMFTTQKQYGTPTATGNRRALGILVQVVCTLIGCGIVGSFAGKIGWLIGGAIGFYLGGKAKKRLFG